MVKENYRRIVLDEKHHKALKKAESKFSAFEIGKCYFIRTVTYHLTGRVQGISIVGGIAFLLLKDAAWIAVSARFMNTIKNGELSEVEPVGDAIVGIGTITDAFPWNHPLPMEQK